MSKVQEDYDSYFTDEIIYIIDIERKTLHSVSTKDLAPNDIKKAVLRDAQTLAATLGRLLDNDKILQNKGGKNVKVGEDENLQHGIIYLILTTENNFLNLNLDLAKNVEEAGNTSVSQEMSKNLPVEEEKKVETRENTRNPRTNFPPKIDLIKNEKNELARIMEEGEGNLFVSLETGSRENAQNPGMNFPLNINLEKIGNKSTSLNLELASNIEGAKNLPVSQEKNQNNPVEEEKKVETTENAQKLGNKLLNQDLFNNVERASDMFVSLEKNQNFFVEEKKMEITENANNARTNIFAQTIGSSSISPITLVYNHHISLPGNDSLLSNGINVSEHSAGGNVGGNILTYHVPISASTTNRIRILSDSEVHSRFSLMKELFSMPLSNSNPIKKSKSLPSFHSQI
jgi:hypothetical protein